MAWYDYVPGVSNVAGALEGDWRQAALGAGGEILEDVGILPGEVEQPTRPDTSQYFGTPEANAAEQLRRAYELQAGAAGFAPSATVREPAPITARDVGELSGTFERARAAESGARVTAPGALSAPQMAPVERVQRQIAGEIERAQGAEIGPARLTERTAVAREGGTEASTALARAAAMGETPSKAEALLRAGIDKAAKKQMSLAAAAKGSERRGARRGALIAIGEQGAEVANQAAALRAEEMARARGEFAQAEQTTARLRQEAANLEAQIDAAAKRGDADAVNRLRAQQAEINTRVSELNAQMATRRQMETAELGQRAQELNVGAANRRAELTAEQALRVGEGNIERTMKAEDINARIAEQDAARQTAVDLANAAAAQRRQEQQYAGRVSGAEREQAAATTTAQLQQQTDRARIEQELQAQQIRQGGQVQALGAAGSAIGQQAGMAGARLAADTAAYTADKAQAMAEENANTQFGIGIGSALGGAIGGPPGSAIGGAAGGALFSDRTVKTDIEPVSDSAAARLADAYKNMVSTYEMKGGDGSTTAGVMAQDLEKDPLGRQFVREMPNGKLGIDYNGLNAAVLKGLAAKMDAQTARTEKARRA